VMNLKKEEKLAIKHKKDNEKKTKTTTFFH
jgi:hypothetical protein